VLKVLRRDHLIDDDHTKMFQREVETLPRLNHPEIAAIVW
jgi:serine/threonine protein kinase